MLYIILVQSFRPLKIKITQFPGGFRLYFAVLGSNNDNRKGNSNSDSSTDKMVMIMAMIMIIIMLIKIINDNHNDNDNDNDDNNNNNILTGFLKTGLAKISTHSKVQSAKLNTDETIFMGGTEYFGETAVQPRDHIPVNTMRKSHNHTLSRH